MRLNLQIMLSVTVLALTASLVQAAGPEQARDLFNQGQYQEALQAANEYLSKHPDNGQARFLRGLSLARTGKTDRAIEVFKGLAKDYPDIAEPQNNLGVLYAKKKEFARAREALEKAVKINPKHAPAQENLGDVYVALAEQAYSKAAKLEPKNVAARAKRKRLQTLLEAPRQQPAQPQAAAHPNHPAQTATPKSKANAQQTETVIHGNDAAAVAAVHAWSRAWSSQNVSAYLDAYSSDFQPESGQSHSAWRRERQQRVGNPNYIEVQISDLEITDEPDGRALVTFDQRYRSGSYRDHERKGLLLQRQDGAWKIVREGKASQLRSEAGRRRHTATQQQPDPNPAASSAAQEQIRSMVYAWAKAWSNQDVTGYLTYYSNNFQPQGGKSLQSWVRERQDRLTSPSYIRIKVSDIRVQMDGGDSATVRFKQRYRSDDYSDTSHKVLHVRHEADGWRIVRES